MMMMTNKDGTKVKMKWKHCPDVTYGLSKHQKVIEIPEKA
jgi:hypothetical protein